MRYTPFQHPGFVRANLGPHDAPFSPFPGVVRARLGGRFLWSMPFGGYGGPPDGNSELLNEAAQELDGAVVVDFWGWLRPRGWDFIPLRAHVVDLERPLSLSANRRRELKLPIRVSLSESPKPLLLFRTQMAERGAWVPPARLVERVFREMGPAGWVLVAEREGRAVGALGVLAWGQIAVWWINTWDPQGGKGAMTHLLVRAMDMAKKRGFPLFSMGISPSSGPARFKESLGARVWNYGMWVFSRGLRGWIWRRRQGF